MNSRYCFMDFEDIDANPMCRMDMAYLMVEKKQRDVITKFQKLKGKHISSGYTVGKMPTQFSEDGPVFCVRSENLRDNKVDLKTVQKRITVAEYNQQPEGSKIAGEEFLMISAGARSGYFSLNQNTGVKCVTNEAVTHIEIKEDIANKEYLIYLFNCLFLKEQIENMRTKGATPNFKYAHFKHLVIPLPTLEEQNKTLPKVKSKISKLEQKIKVLEEEKQKNSLQNVIDRVFEEEFMIDRAKYEVNNYNKLVNSASCLYYKVFEGLQDELDFLLNTKFNIQKDLKSRRQYTKLIELLDIPLCMGGTTKKHTENTGYHRIMVKNLSSMDEKMKVDDIDDIDDITVTSYKNANEKNVLKFGDILFSAAGAGCLGNMVINNTKLKAVIDSHVGILRLKDSSLALFMYYYLTSYLGKQQIFRCITGTTGQISLNMTKMNKILIPQLSEVERQAIIDKINLYKQNQTIIDKQIRDIQNTIDTDLNRYILNGYSEDLFNLEKGV